MYNTNVHAFTVQECKQIQMEEICFLPCVYSEITVMFQLHFTNDQFEPKVLEAYGKKKLKPNAVPTLFSHLRPPKERKPPAKRSEVHKKCSKRRKALFNDISTQGVRWEAGTLVKSLRLRLACGSRGYGLLRELGYPLPSDRTLQRHIQHAKFRPGLLTDILEPLRVKV
ncbi:uncharacterized protein LOC125943468 [Dermacentor silvarum]|uniref:uncharacterized protein LOC125943468 n=1 Tax=Dermacentor silvarum TaxID=543639 RepID=UPI00210168CB|nr:uncharacterized protein LOC125943468 [Dermacentor silvarum]